MGLFILYDNSNSCALYWHGLSYDPYMLHDLVYLYGYPGEHSDCTASPRGDHDCWSSIYGHGDDVSYQGSYRFHYPIDTHSGQSGSGVYKISGGDRYVVGTHKGGYSGSQNQGVWVNSGKWDWIHDIHDDFEPTYCSD